MVPLILVLVLLAGNVTMHYDYGGQTLKPIAAPSIVATAAITDDIFTGINLSEFNLTAWDAEIEKRWQDALNQTRFGSLDKAFCQEF